MPILAAPTNLALSCSNPMALKQTKAQKVSKQMQLVEELAYKVVLLANAIQTMMLSRRFALPISCREAVRFTNVHKKDLGPTPCKLRTKMAQRCSKIATFAFCCLIGLRSLAQLGILS